MPDQIFISYSHQDKRWLEMLQTMLKPLVRDKQISVWDDTKIKAGAHWREEIKRALASTKVAVLLVSPDFLGSDFFAEHELPHLLDAAKVEGLTILWIAVRPSMYSETDIERYQAVNDPAKPLSSLRKSERDKELVRICEQIKQAVNGGNDARPQSSPPLRPVPSSISPNRDTTASPHALEPSDQQSESKQRDARILSAARNVVEALRALGNVVYDHLKELIIFDETWPSHRREKIIETMMILASTEKVIPAMRIAVGELSVVMPEAHDDDKPLVQEIFLIGDKIRGTLHGSGVTPFPNADVLRDLESRISTARDDRDAQAVRQQTQLILDGLGRESLARADYLLGQLKSQINRRNPKTLMELSLHPIVDRGASTSDDGTGQSLNTQPEPMLAKKAYNVSQVDMPSLSSRHTTATKWSPQQQLTGPLRVFLCHSAGDKPAVRDLYHRLQNDGFQPWLDEEDLLPGQDWQQEIPRAVRSSHIVIVCLSKSSVTKTGYVQEEIKYALDVAEQQPKGTIFIIPVRLEECDVLERLRRWQWVNLFEERGYNRLVQALRAREESISTGDTLKHTASPNRNTVELNSVTSEKANSRPRLRVLAEIAGIVAGVITVFIFLGYATYTSLWRRSSGELPSTILSACTPKTSSAATSRNPTELEALLQEARQWDLKFCHTFDKMDAHGWDVGGHEDEYGVGQMRITPEGKYSWDVVNKQVTTWLVPPPVPVSDPAGDFYATVEVRKLAGSSEQIVPALVFRSPDDNNSYSFRVRSNGQLFSAFKYSPNQSEMGYMQNMDPIPSNTIREDEANKLTVIARGPAFYFYVNDEFVGQTVDSRLDKGRVLLGVVMPQQGGGEHAAVEWDNFELRVPPQP